MIECHVAVLKSAQAEGETLAYRLTRAITQEVHYLASAAAKRAPVAGGQLRRTISGNVLSDARGTRIDGYLSMEPIWPYVEFGTGPHRNPYPPMPVYLTDEQLGTGSIERWLIEKGGGVTPAMMNQFMPTVGTRGRPGEGASEALPVDKARRSKAFLIARHIRKFGTKPHPFLNPALVERAPRIVSHVERVLRGGQ